MAVQGVNFENLAIFRKLELVLKSQSSPDPTRFQVEFKIRDPSKERILIILDSCHVAADPAAGEDDMRDPAG